MSVSKKCSLIIPVYLNEQNIDPLVQTLNEFSARFRQELEVVFVIDGSPDRSGELLLNAQSEFLFDSQIVFHSRNFGAFSAIRTGIAAATGGYFAVLAADLQEPIEVVETFFSRLASGEVDVVFGVRRSRQDPFLTKTASRLFWGIYRKFVLPDMPSGGVDVFGCSSDVREVLLKIEEPNSSLIAQLFWVGFRREFIPYDRQKRAAGTSAWTFSKKLKYMTDSILSFTDLPILMVLWLGVFGTVLSILFIVYIIVARSLGLIETPGYATTITIVTFFGSLSLLVQGVIGSYVWRTFDNTRRRPLSIVRKSILGRRKKPSE